MNKPNIETINYSGTGESSDIYIHYELWFQQDGYGEPDTCLSLGCGPVAFAKYDEAVAFYYSRHHFLEKDGRYGQFNWYQDAHFYIKKVTRIECTERFEPGYEEYHEERKMMRKELDMNRNEIVNVLVSDFVEQIRVALKAREAAQKSYGESQAQRPEHQWFPTEPKPTSQAADEAQPTPACDAALEKMLSEEEAT